MTKKISPTLTLLALAVSAFAIGSTEFISVGLIPMLIQSFHVSLAQAGLTVSVYALGIMVGAPLMTLLTGQMNRHTLMLMIMGLFIAGNLLAALAPTFYPISWSCCCGFSSWHFYDGGVRHCCGCCGSS